MLILANQFLSLDLFQRLQSGAVCHQDTGRKYAMFPFSLAQLIITKPLKVVSFTCGLFTSMALFVTSQLKAKSVVVGIGAISEGLPRGQVVGLSMSFGDSESATKIFYLFTFLLDHSIFNTNFNFQHPVYARGISIQGEVTQQLQLLCSKSHDFLAIFDLAHSKINQIA